MAEKNKVEIPEGFEFMDCPFCGGSDFKLVFYAKDLLYGIPGKFTISKCGRCALVMQNPMPGRDIIKGYYTEEYEPHLAAEDSASIESKADSQEPRRALVEKYVSGPGRILDVGSGGGAFLYCMKRAGWEAAGCEPIGRMAEFQRKKLGLDVRTGDLLSAGFPGGHFDAVTLWAVFEHLPDPLETLTEVRRVLKPGGACILSMPNFDSLERMIFRARWFSIYAPHHLFHFTPRTVSKFADAASFQVERVMFSTTATSLTNSVRLLTRSAADSNNGPGAACLDADAPAASVDGRGGYAKKFIFNFGLVPFLGLLDALHLGATTNYVLRKK
jgi:SAM-dependent methyltransferase